MQQIVREYSACFERKCWDLNMQWKPARNSEQDPLERHSARQNDESIYRTLYIRREYADQIENLAVQYGISWNRVVILILKSYLDSVNKRT